MVSVASSIECSEEEVYVKFAKYSNGWPQEESWEIYYGTTRLYASPGLPNGSWKTIETCLPVVPNYQYVLYLKDSSDSWSNGAQLVISGSQGNIFFKNYMRKIHMETHTLSLYYGFKKEEQWKLFSGASVANGWTTKTFNDASWRQVTLGTNITNVSGTQYFRRTFSGLAGLAAYEMKLKYRYGAIVHINGKEAYRDNMPTGAVTGATLANGFYFTTDYHGFIRPATEVSDAMNTVAVELHFQTAAGASAVSFDAFLAIYATTTIKDNCYVYPYDRTLIGDSGGGNYEEMWNFWKDGYTSIYSFPTSVTIQLPDSRPFINAVRIYPTNDIGRSPSTFSLQGSMGSEWKTITGANGASYPENSVHKHFFSYSNADMYTSYRAIFNSAVSSSELRVYEFQPMICSFAPATSMSFSPSSYTFYAVHENVLISPTGTYSSCSVVPALPSGVSLNADTCTLSGKATVATTATTYTMTSTTDDGVAIGEFTMQIISCAGTMVQFARNYQSNPSVETFSVRDATTNEVVFSVAANSSQVVFQTWSTFVCLTGERYVVHTGSSGLNFWAAESHLEIRAMLSGSEYETLGRMGYDALLGIPNEKTFNVKYIIPPLDNWYYRTSSVSGWTGSSTDNWDVGRGLQFPNSPPYFKHFFTVSSVQGISGIVLSLYYRDAIVVYLNGIEVYRNQFDGTCATGSYSPVLYRQVSLPIRTMVGEESSVYYVREGVNVIAIYDIGGYFGWGRCNNSPYFDCALRLMGPDSVSRFFDYESSYSGISGSPEYVHNQHSSYSMYRSVCADNSYTISFAKDRREWISSITLYLHYTQSTQQPTQFLLKARNGNDQWTLLKTVTNLAWSLTGEHKKIWTGNNKPYNQYRFENFATGNPSSCYWKLSTFDFHSDATGTPIPELSYPETLVIFKDIEMGEVYPNSEMYFGFSITPALPSGLSIDADTGKISGTAHELLTSTTFSIQATMITGGESVAAMTLSVEQCTGGKSLITLVARLDSSPSDASYRLYKGRGTTGAVVSSNAAFNVANGLNYADWCLTHDLYTVELFDSLSNGWTNPAGWYLTVDVGAMVVEMGQVPSGVHSVSTTFSSLLPFQINFDEWKLFKSINPVDANWNAVNYNEVGWTAVKSADMGSHVGVTSYLRRSFSIPSVNEYQVLNVRMRYAGGVVVYFNAQKVARFNVPETVTASTLAISERDSTVFSQFHVVLSTANAVSGKNVLAVEVHGASQQSEIGFDATGVFGVNDCSVVVDSYSEVVSSGVSICSKEDLLSLLPTTYGYIANSMGAYLEWTVENLEGSLANNFALHTNVAVSSYGFSVYGRFGEESYMALLSVVEQSTLDRQRSSWPMPVGITGFRQFRFEVDDPATALVSTNAFLLQYCKSTPYVDCPTWNSCQSGQTSCSVTNSTMSVVYVCENGVWKLTEQCPLTLYEASYALNTTAPVTIHPALSGYLFSIQSGSLPTGLVLYAGTGVIAGTPTASGVWSVVIRIRSVVCYTQTFAISFSVTQTHCPAWKTCAEAAMSCVVNENGVTSSYTCGGGQWVLQTACPNSFYQNSYSFTSASTVSIVQTASLTSFSIQSGVLPSGLTLNPSTGAVNGRVSQIGTFSLLVHGSGESCPSTSCVLTITITEALCPVWNGCSAGTASCTVESSEIVSTYRCEQGEWVLQTACPISPYNAVYSVQTVDTVSITPSQSASSFTLQSGSLPAGLRLNSVSGAITGTTSAIGAYPLTIAIHSTNCPSASYSLVLVVKETPCEGWKSCVEGADSCTVSEDGSHSSYACELGTWTLKTSCPVSMYESVYKMTVGEAVTVSPMKTMQSFTLASGALPEGLSFYSSTGEISGMPTTAGAYSVSVTVSDDSCPSASFVVSFAVYEVPPSTTALMLGLVASIVVIAVLVIVIALLMMRKGGKRDMPVQKGKPEKSLPKPNARKMKDFVEV